MEINLHLEDMKYTAYGGSLNLTPAGRRSLHLTMERPWPGGCTNSLGPNKD